MKILFLTQKIDSRDDLLGFVVGWVEKLAVEFEKVTVICLEKGEYNLPLNVEVLSLGKEKKSSRLSYLYNFYKYLWLKRGQYDGVFIHMNPVYAVLGGWLWRLSGQKIILWYIHKKIDKFLKPAVFFCHKILTAAPGSFPLATKKLIYSGHGINLDLFKRIPDVSRSIDLLCVGRLAPVKNLTVLAAAYTQISKPDKPRLLFIGGYDVKDEKYYRNVRDALAPDVESGAVQFGGPLPNRQMPDVYNRVRLLINLTPTGSFDKVILEAMACETLVSACNDSLKSVLPPDFIFQENNVDDLAQKIMAILNLSDQAQENYGQQFRDYVWQHHNLDNLIKRVKLIYEDGA